MTKAQDQRHDLQDHDLHNQKVIEQFSNWARRFAELPIHSEADGMARTLAAAAIDPAGRALDVACGPGIVACAVAARAAHVVGVDLTPAMTEQARERQRAAGLENIEWRIGDATGLPFDNESFDLVVTRYSFHHLQQPALALAEMKRVCRPGGRVVVVDAAPSAETQQNYDRMERLRDPSHTSALTLEQLRRLGRDLGLTEAVIDGYRLEARVADLTEAPELQPLNAMLEADLASGKDTIGVGACRAEDGFHIHFPIMIVAWDKPPSA
jgi:ubiquinone/menaquinone biosynthesis C-methylase UbiE